MVAEPEPVSDLNNRLRGDIDRSRRLVWGIILAQGTLLIVVSVVAGLLGWQQLSERGRVTGDIIGVVSAQCSFYEPLVTLSMDSRSGKALTELVEGSRRSYLGLHCGTVPPPSSELLQLGRKWGVRITY